MSTLAPDVSMVGTLHDRHPRAPIDAPAHVLSLLDKLHTLSLEQESDIDRSIYKLQAWTQTEHDFFKDKFIALEKDKCHFVYQLLRSMGATNVVEAGTSFGVSTIYLALAVSQNAKIKAGSDNKGTVIATEKEDSKAEIARQNWKECGTEVEGVIDLRVGDLLETLKKDIPDAIDMLLLDIWAPLALPTLKIVEPKLRRGAVIIADNTLSGAARYEDLLKHIRDPSGSYTWMTLPFNNGLEMAVYSP